MRPRSSTTTKSRMFSQISGKRPRQQRAVAGVSSNQFVDAVGIGKNGFTRAHAVPSRMASTLRFASATGLANPRRRRASRHIVDGEHGLQA